MTAQWLLAGAFLGLVFAPFFINKTKKVQKTIDGEKRWVNEPDGYDYTAITFTVLFAIAFIYTLYNLRNAYKPVN